MEEEVSEVCRFCQGGKWVCENHKHRAWPSERDCGAGAPCARCNTGSPPELPPDFEPAD